jgi:hypothetical protein
MTETWYMGIDPGATGSIGMVNASGTGASVHPMPDTELGVYRLLQNLTTLMQVARAGIEHVNAFPGQGVSTMFRFGYNAGLVRMALIATQVPFDVISAQSWNAELGLSVRAKQRRRSPEEIAAEKAAKKAMTKEQKLAEGRERSAKQRDRKRAYRTLAERLFPALQTTTETADAVLIAECVRRRHRSLLAHIEDHDRHVLSLRAAEGQQTLWAAENLQHSSPGTPAAAAPATDPQRPPEPPTPDAWAL